MERALSSDPQIGCVILEPTGGHFGAVPVRGAFLKSLRELTKRFGANAAVDGVDLDVRAGTLHAIIGPNGAGKTTLFNLLSGELRPTAGTITFRERDVGGLDATSRSQSRRSICPSARGRIRGCPSTYGRSRARPMLSRRSCA